MQDTLYVLAILFGVITLPKATVYGVWRGKGGMDWQHERLEINCQSYRIGCSIINIRPHVDSGAWDRNGSLWTLLTPPWNTDVTPSD